MSDSSEMEGVDRLAAALEEAQTVNSSLVSIQSDLASALSSIDLALWELRDAQKKAPVGAWVSVKERLPNCGESVLVDGGPWPIVAFCIHDGTWKDDDGDRIISPIRHWMHLPQPPKADGAG